MLLLLLLLPPQLGAGSALLKNPEYQVQLQGLVMVQEGLCALVPCSFSFHKAGRNNSKSTPLYWFRKNESHQNGQDYVLVATSGPTKKAQVKVKSSFHPVGDPRAHNCTLSIEAPRRTESGFYYLQLGQRNFSARARNLLVLSVTELTQTPEIHIDQPLASGQSSSLRCSLPGACAHGGPPIVSWHGEVLGPLGMVTNSSEISLAPRPQDHGTQLTCRVTVLGANVSTERTITLNVSYAPQNLTLSVFREDCAERRELDNGSSIVVKEGASLVLVCGAHGNPPPRLSWVWGSRLLPPAQSSGAGVLALHPVEQNHEGKFTCRAEHPRGSLHASLHLFVGTSPQLLGPSCSWEAQDLHCSCSSHARPAPALRWWLDQGLLLENRSNASFQVTSSSQGPWANSSLSLREGFGTGLTVRCEAQNVHGSQSASVLLMPGQPGLSGGIVLGAVGGAGVASLLALCLCFLVLTVKACKKRAPEKVAGRDEAPAPSGPTSWGFQLEHLSGGPPDPPMDSLGPREKPELHYAVLNFQGLRPCAPVQAAASTEYAEIRTHK
ncbi:sialic acid-binding Ig-like lectin 5 [Sorex araneus]|uniref:sialic acid-binding Ig-like lectin 5 n=1 Tax=Sorex araneus TaxID=42254 RepID=UPI002433D1C7|nr:sialic acid-binding Ig-like lectin 5 [Sorex araneus]